MDLTTIPMPGVACGRCGYPALRLEIGPRGRHVIHLDPRQAPCPAPIPEAARIA